MVIAPPIITPIGPHKVSIELPTLRGMSLGASPRSQVQQLDYDDDDAGLSTDRPVSQWVTNRLAMQVA